MKPSAFEYHRPGTVDEAVATLAETGDDGKVLAGGQSLVPMLTMRLAAPAHLVDINRVHGLDGVRVVTEGGRSAVRVGATARHADVERDPDVWSALPLLRQALGHVAHPAIRNRGTTVGSLAHADPAAEMNAVLALLGGSVTLRSSAGTRVVDADELVTGPMQTCLLPGELATEALFPVPAGHTGSAWLEVARRSGDYAVCGVGVLVTVDDELRVSGMRAAYVSMGPAPWALDLTEPVAGAATGAAEWAAAGRLAAARLDPDDDIHATAAYRRHLAGVLTARAARTAAEQAVARAGETTGART